LSLRQLELVGYAVAVALLRGAKERRLKQFIPDDAIAIIIYGFVVMALYMSLM
jgi:hypothetical protein